MKNSTEEYNFESAFHYKAYRPPLHKLILNRFLKDQQFESALDVGCGVGNSTLALTDFCNRIVGFDPSELMIQNAHLHKKATYTSRLNEIEPKYDLLVFFGSLFYIDNAQFEFFLKNLICDGTILCCDFQLVYAPVVEDLKISEGGSDYDPAKNLDSFETKQTKLLHSEQFEMKFECTTLEGSHLLFSENHLRKKIKKKYGGSNSHNALFEDLKRLYPTDKLLLNAKLYGSRYKKVGH